MSKSNDAQIEATHLASRLSSTLEKQSNLTRFSGRALYVRLAKLFPNNASGLNANTFALESASGANQAISQISRPVNALELVAVKNNVSSLCSQAAVPSSYASVPAGSIYSNAVWLPGEAAPRDEALLAATIIARNSWLEPIATDSPEVLALAESYRTILNDSSPGDQGSARALAHRALCMGTLLSAQFSLGIPGPVDAFRRMMIEVGSRVPTFDEINSILTKSKTSDQYLAAMQADPGSGYYTAVHQWHQDWLGLRYFIDDSSTTDLRPSASWTSSAMYSYLGATGYSVRTDASTNPPLIDLEARARSVEFPYACDTAKVQNFDPRTSMILLETNSGSPSSPQWEVQGGFVAVDRIADYQAQLAAHGAAAINPAGDCSLFSAGDHNHRVNPAGPNAQPDLNLYSDGRFSAAMPVDYYRCKGRVGGNLAEMKNLDKSKGRTRRFSPSGEQDGVSQVKSWYTSSPRLVCNSIPRFLLTCSLRPTYTGWDFIGNIWGAYNGNLEPGSGLLNGGSGIWSIGNLGHPGILNQYRCGKPNSDELAKTLPNYRDELAFPYGYDRAQYLTNNPSLLDLNEVIINGQALSETGAEGDAIKRLRTDIRLEPYRLVDYILQNNRSYKELVTANYIVGHDELDLYYRAQAMRTPVYPVSAQHNLAASKSIDAPTTAYSLSSYQPMSENWFHVPSAPDNSYVNRDMDTTTQITHRPGAGVLVMPAFITPVGQKMRTLASRYFTRMLCGDPGTGTFAPNSSEKSLHEKYMLDKDNPATSHAAALHLDQKTSCYGCHVNLDPLGAALSSSYLAQVQQNEAAALNGDFGTSESLQAVFFYETRGRGAFLGKEVNGIEQVGKVMADSDIWAKCVVDQTFQNVFGRVRQIADQEAFNSYLQSFKSNYNYNRLVRTLVSSPLYQGAN